MEHALAYGDRAMTFMVSRRLAELFRGQAVLECYDSFDIAGFIRYGRGDARLCERMAHQENVWWNSEESRLVRKVDTSWIEVEWEGERFQVLRTDQEKCGVVYWVVGPDPQIEEFMSAVLAYTTGRSPSTHVYTGWWSESESFEKAIQLSSWDDLVLPGGLREILEMHTVGFFESKDDFEQLGVPWKRGLLLTGPPGNGKTHLIRALLKRLAVPRLIVKSFGDDADDVQEVFDKVRELAPCVLVLEDIDSLIRPALLSTVLNSLDGTEPLDGVLVLATTNHPEKLDPAIRNRPSRFDRVLEFGPPAFEQRLVLLRKLLSRGPASMRLTSVQLKKVAEMAEGFSYAYLKELAISSAVVWGRERAPGSMFGIVKTLVAELRGQINSSTVAEDE